MKYNFDEVIDRSNNRSSKYDERLKKFGTEDVIPLWVADMDFKTAQPIIDACKKKAEEGIWGYTSRPASYFEAVQEWEEKYYGWKPETSHMSWCLGVVQTMAALMKIYTMPGDKVLIQTPVYSEFYDIPEAIGRVVEENPLVEENGSWHVDYEDFERKVKECKVFLLCNPHNPLGLVWDKEDLENEYTRFAQQYDELKMTISNDSLAQLLDQEQLKTQRLLEELRTVKSTNATEIRRLKKELATLRKVMIGYINQIDSLNKLTEQQKLVIADVTKKYNQASQQISNLSEEKKNLNKKVTLAAQLDATNIRIEPRNKRGKVAKKVKDVVKLAISFTVVKNITAENGERTIYIRITKPDNDVLTKSASNTFPYENRTLVYSIKKYIEYNGEEQNINVFWDVEEFLYAGNYRVDIFEGGNLIGSQTFMLD